MGLCACTCHAVMLGALPIVSDTKLMDFIVCKPVSAFSNHVFLVVAPCGLKKRILSICKIKKKTVKVPLEIRSDCGSICYLVTE